MAGVVTANITSWGALKDTMATLSKQVAVAMLQETKADEGKREELANELLRTGWASSWAPAAATAKHGKSAGVALCWRKHLDLAAEPEVVVPHRAIMAPLRFSTVGTIGFYSLYGVTGSSTDGDTGEILREVLKHIRSKRQPALIGGDFNTSWQDVRQWAEQMETGWQVFAPELPTHYGHCAASTIDFFAASGDAALLLGARPTVQLVAPTAPHRPVHCSLSLSSGTEHVMVRDGLAPAASPGARSGVRAPPRAAAGAMGGLAS